MVLERYFEHVTIAMNRHQERCRLKYCKPKAGIIHVGTCRVCHRQVILKRDVSETIQRELLMSRREAVLFGSFESGSSIEDGIRFYHINSNCFEDPEKEAENWLMGSEKAILYWNAKESSWAPTAVQVSGFTQPQGQAWQKEDRQCCIQYMLNSWKSA